MEKGVDSSMVHDPVPPRSAPVENPIDSISTSSEATDSATGSSTASPTGSNVRGENEAREAVAPTAERRPHAIPGADSFYKDPKMWPGVNYPSTLNTMDILESMVKDFKIPESHRVALPRERHRIYHRPEFKEDQIKGHYVGVSRTAFKCGL